MRTTRLLLLAAVIAGPVYVFLGLAQALTRPGFDVTRHDLSLLSLGSLGWIQVVNFCLSGLLSIAGALGMRRALNSGPASSWAPLLVGVYGAGLVAAGCFSADPVPDFPPGSSVAAGTVSWHGLVHLLCAAIAFSALIAAMLVLARRWSEQAERGWAGYSIASGMIVLLLFLGVVSGLPLVLSARWGTRLSVIGLWIAVLLAWTWISLTAVKLISAGELAGRRVAYAERGPATGLAHSREGAAQ
jgi:hypothetical protein